MSARSFRLGVPSACFLVLRIVLAWSLKPEPEGVEG